MKNIVLAISLLFLVGCGSDSSNNEQVPDDITGVWEGTVEQPNYGSYPAEMKLNHLVLYTESGTIDYPTLNCGGTLTLINVNKNEYTFQEKLTKKATCIDNGIVKVEKFNNTLKWQWAHATRPEYAYATLTRKH